MEKQEIVMKIKKQEKRVLFVGTIKEFREWLKKQNQK